MMKNNEIVGRFSNVPSINLVANPVKSGGLVGSAGSCWKGFGALTGVCSVMLLPLDPDPLEPDPLEDEP